MATAKKQLAATTAAAAKKATPAPAKTTLAKPTPPRPVAPSALTVDPRTVAPRPVAAPFGQTIGNLLGGLGNAIRPALQQVPDAIRQQQLQQQPGRSLGQSIGGLLGGIGNAIRPAIQQVPDAIRQQQQLAAQAAAQQQLQQQLAAQAAQQQFPQVLPRGPVNPYSIDPVRQPGMGSTQPIMQPPPTATPTQTGFGQYGFDPALVDYLNKQREMSMLDAGVAYQYDPVTQTFTGGTMGGPVTKTLAEMQAEAANRAAATPIGGMPGFGGDPRFPGIGGLLGGRPQLPPQFQDAYNAQNEIRQQEMAAMQPYQQRIEAAMNANPAYQQIMQLSQQLGPNANPQQLQQLQQLQAQIESDPAIRAARTQAQGASMEFQQRFAQPLQQQYGQQLQQLQQFDRLQNMQPPVSDTPRAGLPQFASPFATSLATMGQPMPNTQAQGPRGPGFGGMMPPPVKPFTMGQAGLGQVPQFASSYASQMAAAGQQVRPTAQAQPRPAAPSNYGGFQSIQGMGANQYGGFNAPPPPMQQPQQQYQQPQPQQNNMFGSFGGAQQPAQNQGPNQQAQAAGQAGAALGGGLF